ncbi:MAG: tRNA epoxyqueuosine(34) reductase QueG, partial [Planctomycetota bacterium]
MPPDAKARILEAAREIGFSLAGVAPAAIPPGADALARWLDQGFEAGMAFMRRDHAKRADPRALCPWANSVVCVAVSYGDSIGAAPIARYARGPDYHDVLRGMLGRLEAAIREVGGEGTRTKACVDTAPILERAHARRAGLGWIGKNACLIHPTLGSRLFLGEILTSLDLAASTPLPDACGDCRACLEACPTGALVEPHILDARRCIAYLTIEHEGAIPEDLRPRMGLSVFGCDRCQDACPWNGSESENELLHSE